MTQGERASWLHERRRIHEERMDTRFAPIYDLHWVSVIDQTHQLMLERFHAVCIAQAALLDAACGTGKYWPPILATGREVVGIDVTQPEAGMYAACSHSLNKRMGVFLMWPAMICAQALR